MADYNSFITQINRKLKIDLSYYKETQMKRRITSLRNKRGFDTYTSYFTALNQDQDLLNEFIDRITINVTEFYRNSARWDVLREKVFPKLIENKKSLTIWSAACSTGDEPYSLAIMLAEHFPQIKASILATDLDEKVLEKAKQGIYVESDLKELPAFKKAKYFTKEDNKFHIDDQIKKYITFRKHDLLKDPYPTNVDLIVCRNVLIYFTEEAKDLIYTNFSKSLISNGILFVGSTEQIFNQNKYNLSLFDTFFYRKDEEASRLIN